MINGVGKRIIFGNVQLLEYCKRRRIDIAMLQECEIERMNHRYFFVRHKKGIRPTMESDIATQPDVVLVMDAGKDKFQFEETRWTDDIRMEGV